MPEVIVEVQLRERNQLTVPAEAAAALDVRPGARLVLSVDSETHVATVRPLRDSYAGVAGAAYGRNSREKTAYAKRERDAWSK
jgi:bifunctional DNA-binding transcriptional regulator/antitoxin component of YhaV-PrlF toxin-antitoxin module